MEFDDADVAMPDHHYVAKSELFVNIFLQLEDYPDRTGFSNLALEMAHWLDANTSDWWVGADTRYALFELPIGDGHTYSAYRIDPFIAFENVEHLKLWLAEYGHLDVGVRKDCFIKYLEEDEHVDTYMDEVRGVSR